MFYCGRCKYLDSSDDCSIDRKPCDYRRKSTPANYPDEHCHQEDNSDLRISIDKPFFSCHNLCSYFYGCNRT